MSIQAVSGASMQPVQPDPAADRNTEMTAEEQAGLMDQMQKEQEEAGQSLVEMIREAQEKAAAQRDALKVPKNTRYSDAPLEAYARLARAKNRGQVNSASGFARRKIAELKSAMRSDSDNAIRIKGSIRQLEKAISRGEKKKKELDRERLMELRKARSKEQEQRNELELRRRKAQRMIRESGYLREADVADRLATQLTATQMELRQQAQQLATTMAASVETAAQQYTATAASYSAGVSAPAPELSVEG